MAVIFSLPHLHSGQQWGPAYVVHMQGKGDIPPLIGTPFATFNDLPLPRAEITETIGTEFEG